MLILRFLRFYFHHLYHSLAFTYDLVAAAISFGQWNNWIEVVLPHIKGKRVLELGYGPGHLQGRLLGQGASTFGLDESAQMGRIARRRILHAGETHANLTRGLGQALPFPARSFDSLVATFPAEYILEKETLSEAQRVLRDGGRFILLPAVWPKNWLLHWLYRITGESPSASPEITGKEWDQSFHRAGFEAKAEICDVKSGILLLIIAVKTG